MPSPDGRWLAFTQRGSGRGNGVYLLDLERRAEPRLLRPFTSASDISRPLCWLPDSSRLLMAQQQNAGEEQIIEVELNGHPTAPPRHIFQPAGMTRTSFVDCAERAPDLAVGYEIVDGAQRSNCETAPVRGFAAGGQVSTARDMFRFLRALQTGRLIPLQLFAEATRTHERFMGLGFFATNYGPDIPLRDFRWGHGGAHPGVSTDIRAYPRTGEIVVVLANRDAPISHRVADFLHEQDGH